VRCTFDNTWLILFLQILSVRCTSTSDFVDDIKRLKRQTLLKYVVPDKILAQLDLKTLELANESHVDDKFRKSMTDLVYVYKRKDGTLARLCFLFEHKSSHPGEYKCELIEKLICILYKITP
jgi:hypothetical protein